MLANFKVNAKLKMPVFGNSLFEALIASVQTEMFAVFSLYRFSP